MTTAGLFQPLPRSPSLRMYSQSTEAQNTFISFLVYSFINIQQMFTELQRNPGRARWNLELPSIILHCL